MKLSADILFNFDVTNCKVSILFFNFIFSEEKYFVHCAFCFFMNFPIPVWEYWIAPKFDILMWRKYIQLCNFKIINFVSWLQNGINAVLFQHPFQVCSLQRFQASHFCNFILRYMEWKLWSLHLSMLQDPTSLCKHLSCNILLPFSRMYDYFKCNCDSYKYGKKKSEFKDSDFNIGCKEQQLYLSTV